MNGPLQPTTLTKFRTNSILLAIIAILFVLFFNFTKQDPTFSAVNPFATDPYDAIGSFAVQGTMFFTALMLLRTFRPFQSGLPSRDAITLLVRSQIVILLAVIVTLASDCVALLRHPSMWLGQADGAQLALLTVGFGLVVGIVAVYVIRSTKKDAAPPEPKLWKKPLLVSILAALILFLYPERAIESTPGALLTVIVGAFLLFLPLRAWAEVLSPARANRPNILPLGWLWAGVIVAGIGLGLAVVFLELTQDGGTFDLANQAFIIAVYIGLEVAGVMIGYTFLGKFLGLFERNKELAQ